MQAFANLYAGLDAGGDGQEGLAALLRYLAGVPEADLPWALHLLGDGKVPPSLSIAALRAAATQAAGLDDWLFDASHQAVGDLAETIALILPAAGADPDGPADPPGPLGLAGWMDERLPALRGLPPADQVRRLQRWWPELDAAGRLVLVRLVSGTWRSGFSRLLLQRALALHSGLDPHLMAQRLSALTAARRLPTAQDVSALFAPAQGAANEAGRPYAFQTADELQPSACPPAGPFAQPGHWQIEWHYDGLRVQIVKRDGDAWIWTADGELVHPRVPEVHALALDLPDGTVLEGELLVWSAGAPSPGAAALLQQRLARKTATPALLAKAPAVFVARDLLESEGLDRRGDPRHRRRARLEALLHGRPAGGWCLPPLLDAPDLNALARLRRLCRRHGALGLRLDHRLGTRGDGPGGDGPDELPHTAPRVWKAPPMSVSAVLIYAQAVPGRRAAGGFELTFAVWNRKPVDETEAQAVVEAIARREPPQAGALQLLTLTRTQAEPGDADLERIDQVVRTTTVEKFGPVRSLRPTLLCEIAFDDLARSTRHKSGVVLSGARMAGLQEDRSPAEADDIGTVLSMLDPHARSD